MKITDELIDELVNSVHLSVPGIVEDIYQKTNKIYIDKVYNNLGDNAYYDNAVKRTIEDYNNGFIHGLNTALKLLEAGELNSDGSLYNIDKIELHKMFLAMNIQMNINTVDKITDIVRLLYYKGDKVNLLDLKELQETWIGL